MIKHVGILTFHASHNYGSMLQAYALQTYLEREGYDVTIINHRGYAQKLLFIKPGRLLKKKYLREFISSPRVFLQSVGKWNKFERFMREYFHLSHEYVDLVRTEKAINGGLGLDAVITGSDQIWNMNCLDFSPAYYLPFETPGIRRIAYAPSLGDEQWWRPLNYASMLRVLVDNYDFPSVREKSSSAFLSELLGRPVPAVADPVFLLKQQDYELLAGKESLIKGNYLFYYTPQPDKSIEEYVSKLAKRLGYKVVMSNKGKGKGNEETDFIPYCDAGPIEFLNLMRHATLVCGWSMHMVAFSLLLHKPFFAVSRSEGARIRHLLDEVGLLSRLVKIDDNFETVDQSPIDWDQVEIRLNTLRQTGYRFLENALS